MSSLIVAKKAGMSAHVECSCGGYDYKVLGTTVNNKYIMYVCQCNKPGCESIFTVEVFVDKDGVIKLYVLDAGNIEADLLK